jgi:alkanesulfonate monooxygenase
MPVDVAIAEALAPVGKTRPTGALQVFSTCPSSLTTPDDYRNKIAEVARWSEAAGCTGILVYTDNSLADPWLVSQIIIQSTQELCPLVAVQPVYMHPYSVAKTVSTIALLHERRVFLNMVAGGFKRDLDALNDTTPHDSRYQRLTEYTQIVQQLLGAGPPLSFEGQFYQTRNLTLNPPMNPALRPGVLMSGSSEAGLAAARATGAIAIEYPEPPENQAQPGSGPRGARLGVVTREREDEAWEVALARFPEDRKGQLTRQFATKVSDSVWHHRLAELGRGSSDTRDTYWLQPFENYQTNCPYLVGSYESVTRELVRYVALGIHTFVLDIPASEEEFKHTGAVFESAAQRAGV